MDVVADEVRGVYQADEAARFFGLDLEKELEEADIPEEERAAIESWADYEFAWEAIEDFAAAVADDLNKKLELPGTVYFGHTETGDYGLLYTWETGDHPKFDARR